MQKDDVIYRQAAIDALCHVDEYNGRSVEAVRNLPSAQPDMYEALRILDAIHSSGRLDYGDYCDLHDAISEIGGAKNG